MKKRLLIYLLTLILAFSVLGTGCSNLKESDFTWKNYSESDYAYLLDMYNYTIPEVVDKNGNEYEVFVEVADAQGNKVDNFGGFFLIEREEDYKVIYTIDCGSTKFSKTTTVSGIEKAKYNLENNQFMYEVNDEIDLNNRVSASLSGAISYSVVKDGQQVELVDNKFTPTQSGTYTVNAKIDRQPNYAFDLIVVDRQEIAYPFGLVLDGTSAQDISTSSGFDDFSASVTFDQTKKYDSQSNGSYKIVAETNGDAVAEHRTIEFKINPAYHSDYYKSLKENGYEYIAIRYMIESSEHKGTSRFDYISATGEHHLALYYSGSKVFDKVGETASYTFWSNQLDRVPTGAWAEMLLDINKFTDYYNDQPMTLFRLFVNKGSSWDLTMYIDNVYAVKGEVVSTITASSVDKDEYVDVSNLSSGNMTGDVLRTVSCGGEVLSVENNQFKAEKQGVYSVDFTDRTMYGSVKYEYVVNAPVVPYEAANFSATHMVHNNEAATKQYSAKLEGGKIVVSSGGKGNVSSQYSNVTTYKVNTHLDVTYFQSLQRVGFEYITYEYTLSFSGKSDAYSIYRYAFVKSDKAHHNNITAFTYKVLEKGLTIDKIFDTNSKASNKGFQSTSYPNANWNGKTFIVSIPIQTVIDNYASQMRILAFAFVGAAEELEYSVTFGEICATKSACVFDSPQAAE